MQAVLRGGSAAAAGARGKALTELRFLCRQVTTADLRLRTEVGCPPCIGIGPAIVGLARVARETG